jgi:N-terminal domain of (some) glycogen debranching enzymes
MLSSLSVSWGLGHLSGGLVEGSVNVVSPGAYVVSDGRGDVDGSAGQGLFYRDVRHLSRLRLMIGGEPLVELAARVRGSEAEFVLAAGSSGIGVVRRRSVGHGMTEEILLRNEASRVVEARVELECAAAFWDVFEVRGYLWSAERGDVSEEARDRNLRFGYRREGFRRGTVVRVSGADPRKLDDVRVAGVPPSSAIADR